MKTSSVLRDLRSLVPAGLVLALAGALLPPPALAGVFTSSAYQCAMDVSAGTDTCIDGVIGATTVSGSQRVARINLAAGYVRLDAIVDVCNPTGFWFHLADSPTGDGGGGDSFNTDHDAETYGEGTGFRFFGNFNYSRGVVEPIYQSDAVVPASGCSRVQWTVYENQASFDNDANPADAPLVDETSLFGFEKAPYNETDTEDTSGADANLWYAGVNRTVGNASRSGTGVSRVCFVLSTTTGPAASTISSLCP